MNIRFLFFKGKEEYVFNCSNKEECLETLDIMIIRGFDKAEIENKEKR